MSMGKHCSCAVQVTLRHILGVLDDPEHGGNIYLRNIGKILVIAELILVSDTADKLSGEIVKASGAHIYITIIMN
jgi:hypothetical protein